jgi:hypothetical protein
MLMPALKGKSDLLMGDLFVRRSETRLSQVQQTVACQVDHNLSFK